MGAGIFSTSVTPENNFVFWDGYKSDGSPGIYYYEAHVLFDVRDPARRKQRMSGWVHVID